MNRPFALLAVSLMLLQAPTALAQAQDGAEVRLALGHDGPAWVGEKIDLYLELWTRDLSFSGQAFTLPEAQGGYLLQPDSTTVKLSGRRAGEDWQGLRYILSLYPQRAGAVRVPSFAVRFSTSAGYGSEPTPRAFDTQALTVDAVLPPGAEPGALLVTTADFSLETRWEPQPVEPGRAELKAGDALVLTVTRRAQDVPGMVFEPLPAFDIDGLGVYADAPEVRDRVDRGSLAGTRVDRITVVFERPGSYVLPGLEFAWWDPAREELKRLTVEPLAVEVAENPAWAGATPAAEAEGYAFRWTDTLWIVAAVVLLWWPVGPLLLRALRWLIRELRPRRLAPLNP